MICSRCKEDKPTSEFGRRLTGKLARVRGYSYHCFECDKIVQRSYRLSSKGEYNKKARQRRNERKLRAITYKGGVCEICRQSFHQAAFDFHHIDPTQKDTDVGLMMGLTDENLFRELDKCILLCANCHRINHFMYGY